MSLNTFIGLAVLNPNLLWRMLASSALVGGILAWLALFKFYWLQHTPWLERALGMGVLDHTILASQVMGVLGVVLFFIRSWLPEKTRGCLWAVSCLGYLSFMLMSRSKGPLIALIACLTLSFALMPSRRSLLQGICTLAISVLGIGLFPEILLRGGLSARPQLLQAAWEQVQTHPWLGIGLANSYELRLPETSFSFEHAHNLYMHITVQLGVIGLLLWVMLQFTVISIAWSARGNTIGRTLCALWCFSAVALFSDGIGPWIKPREEWFTVWLPIFSAYAFLANPTSLVKSNDITQQSHDPKEIR